jgi:hypothetical protein
VLLKPLHKVLHKFKQCWLENLKHLPHHKHECDLMNEDSGFLWKIEITNYVMTYFVNAWIISTTYVMPSFVNSGFFIWFSVHFCIFRYFPVFQNLFKKKIFCKKKNR